MVRICELIVSVGLNQALKGRPGRIAVEFRTRVNGLARRFGFKLENICSVEVFQLFDQVLKTALSEAGKRSWVAKN